MLLLYLISQHNVLFNDHSIFSTFVRDTVIRLTSSLKNEVVCDFIGNVATH